MSAVTGTIRREAKNVNCPSYLWNQLQTSAHIPTARPGSTSAFSSSLSPLQAVAGHLPNQGQYPAYALKEPGTLECLSSSHFQLQEAQAVKVPGLRSWAGVQKFGGQLKTGEQ